MFWKNPGLEFMAAEFWNKLFRIGSANKNMIKIKATIIPEFKTRAEG